jgi:hypothetical protein
VGNIGSRTITGRSAPAPLGLAAFALTTFILSGHNATFIPDLIWVGLALFYGGHRCGGLVYLDSRCGDGMSSRPVLPVGAPFWGELPVTARRPSPMPRRVEG